MDDKMTQTTRKEKRKTKKLKGTAMQVDYPNEILLDNVEKVTTTQVKEPVIIDLENKMAIIYNVLKACLLEKTENIYYFMDHIVSRLVFLTNLERHVLSEIFKKTKEPQKSDILEESVLECPLTDYLLRDILARHYIKYNSIPKSETLNHMTKENSFNLQLHQILKNSGYIWRRLSKTKKAILVEHPKRVMERLHYLQKIINYRNQIRRIVYIETKILHKADKNISHFQKYLTETANYIVMFIAVVNNGQGFINAQIFMCKSIFKSQKVIEDHIIENIIPKLSEPTVIILEDKPFYRKSFPVPTIESEKSEMFKWLTDNGIPHEQNLHRSELFELIQSCKTKRDLHNFDAVVHAHGHEILRRPPKTDYLNYYKPLWFQMNFTEEITTDISKKNQECWNALEKSLIRKEMSVFSEDLEMENITDNILNMAKNVDVSEWADAECEEEEDSLAREEFIIEVKNSFSPEEMQIREQQFILEIDEAEKLIQNKTR